MTQSVRPAQEFKKIPVPTDLANRSIPITDNAREVLSRRYLRKGEDGNPIENEQEMFWRVAYHVAKAEAANGGSDADIEHWARKFFDLLTNLRFFPNSPTFTGAGTPLGQLAACFVLGVEDDMGRTGSGIFSTLRHAALIQQTGGGNGFSFSRLRPAGARVKSSGGTATGPIGFMKVYDQAFGVIAQGGSRRGANMGVLRVDHPDIRDFITCKSEEGEIANFNISVAITDKFMEAVIHDTDFNLIDPNTNEVWETVRAREIFDMIVEYAHHNGEPGVLFIDEANRSNPVPHLYDLEATNPCGEQWLGPFENCCLGSVNLAQHITEEGDVDWIKLKESIQTSTRFLDNVVTANAYVPAIPELREAAEKVRRIGLGIMGLADMMYALGVRYGSTEGQEFASQVMEFVRYITMQTSIDLAKERGSFKAIKGSRYDAENLQWKLPTPIVEHKTNWGRPTLDWEKIENGIRQHGIRNGAQLTVAPTGTIATVTGCEGYGCEPVFALAYMRYVNKNAGNSDEQITLQYTSPQFEKALHEAGLDTDTIDYIIEQVNIKGSCQDIDEVPEALRNTFVVASDISVEEHIRMQAALQAHVDNAISKTINAPAHATLEDVAQAYKLGWELGCKGLTVYVTGSRQKVVLETAETKAEKDSNEAKDVVETNEKQVDIPYIFNHQKKPRPRRLTGYTYRTPTPAGTTYITVNENGHGAGQPFEVFMHTEKAGSEIAAVSEAMGRLMSLILRLSSPVSPRDRIKQIERQLRGIGGRRQWGYGPNRVASLPDGVSQIMRDYLMDTEEGEDSPAMISNGHTNGHKPAYKVENLPSDANYADDGTVEDDDFMMKIGDLCPECGQAAFVREEGCSRCYSCGFSEC